ncbi:MAG: hypothetical protein HQK78_10400, partial [Desulfobacterales bacterium]|nr:hypothetical protein [Desulfobacterales bacterium]
MKPKVLSIGFFLFIFINTFYAYGVSSSIVYRNYVIKHDKGFDILCDSYTVAPNDYIIKIFRQKGEISYKDFSEFLQIFKRLNPSVTDLNLIKPGESILIPLKKLDPNTWDENDTDLVTIPFVKVKNLKESQQNIEKRFFTFEQAADILDAELINSGVYYFPKEEGGEDFELDTSKNPLIFFKSGKRIVLNQGQSFQDSELNVIESFWKGSKVFSVSSSMPLKQILEIILEGEKSNKELSFLDNGIEVKISCNYIFKEDNNTTCITLINDNIECVSVPIYKYLNARGAKIKDIVLNTLKPCSIYDDYSRTTETTSLVFEGDIKKFIRDFFKILELPYVEDVPISFPYSGEQIQALSNIVSL